MKKLANEANDRLSDNCEIKEVRWCEMIRDIFLTKKYTEPKMKKKQVSEFLLKLHFPNKGMDFIKISSILNDPEVISKFSLTGENKNYTPTVIYKLDTPIRSKIFNYIDTVNKIDFNDNETFGTGIHQCECEGSTFCDVSHGHIITGDLNFIKNNKLRKIFSKGPNYREPKTINWASCKKEIITGVDNVIKDMLAKHPNRNFADWKNSILEVVNKKIRSLKTKIHPLPRKKILQDIEVKQYLENLHKNYVIVPIDKASNNVSVICKKYYARVILEEIGKLGETNATYSETSKSKEEIISDDCLYADHLNLEIPEKHKTLPIMYWTPKMHKDPIGKRFIVASKTCSNKILSKNISKIFKLIYNQIENFHKGAKFMSNYNLFWVLNNIEPVINHLERINKRNNAKSISTFDFSTLYTKIPHDQLIERLCKTIDLVFSGGENKCIRISKGGNAYWGNMSNDKTIFTQNSLKLAIQHLIENCYFNVGNIVMRQVIGIPMGIDPAPFWANLFLYSYEEEYMKKLITIDKIKARRYHATSRFIDDLCAINDGGKFENTFRQIYPPSLELKKEHSGTHATFLNLDINIVDKKFIYKLYDKREDFPFTIVRMPHKDSNMPESIFYSSLVGELLRIGRSSLLLSDFVLKANELIKRMIRQGGKKDRMYKSFRKLIERHPETFQKYKMATSSIINQFME